MMVIRVKLRLMRVKEAVTKVSMRTVREAVPSNSQLVFVARNTNWSCLQRRLYRRMRGAWQSQPTETRVKL